MDAKEYKKEITLILHQYCRKGYVDYWSCGRLCTDLCNLLYRAADELPDKALFDVVCRGLSSGKRRTKTIRLEIHRFL